jgi:hypothetical protein
MALLFASAASVIPRFIEYWDETNSIVVKYMEKSNSPDERIRRAAWTEAINSIKRHGVWHSGLVVIKSFGDGVFLFTVSKIIYDWLHKLFLFLRQICSQPNEELITKTSTIKDQVMEFYNKLPEMKNFFAETNTVAGAAVPTTGGAILSEFAGGSLSPTNLLKQLWKLLNSSYSHVVQWMWLLKGQLTFEMTKYAIQICGCICYYFELLDKFWNFGLS